MTTRGRKRVEEARGGQALDHGAGSDEGSPPAGATRDAGTPGTGTRLSAREIYDNVRESAEEELERPGPSIFWSALAAGLTIGFSFVAAAWAASLAPEPLRTAAAAIGYPLGFIFVVIGRQQLFTEQTLEPVIPLLRERTLTRVGQLLRVWGIVLAANLAGTLAFALLASRTSMLSDPALLASLDRVARDATDGGFGDVLYKGVFAGWLIALMAWLIAATRSTGAQIVLVWLSTAPITAFGFAHVVAGSVEAFWRASRGGATWEAMASEFVIPATIGNIIGGVLFVALLNDRQVAAGSPN